MCLKVVDTFRTLIPSIGYTIVSTLFPLSYPPTTGDNLIFSGLPVAWLGAANIGIRRLNGSSSKLTVTVSNTITWNSLLLHLGDSPTAEGASGWIRKLWECFFGFSSPVVFFCIGSDTRRHSTPGRSFSTVYSDFQLGDRHSTLPSPDNYIAREWTGWKKIHSSTGIGGSGDLIFLCKHFGQISTNHADAFQVFEAEEHRLRLALSSTRIKQLSVALAK